MSLKLREPHKNVVESAILPRIIELEPGLSAASFSLMKLLPAQFIIRRAIESGEVDSDTTVIETTSGTFGLGLAMVCRLEEIPLILVGDPVIDRALKRRLTELGARVSIVTGPVLRERGVQQARLDRVANLQSRHRPFFTPQQYDNPLNPISYGRTAELITENLGMIDALICPVGSGGSSCGLASYLRILTPEIQLIGVDTPGSVLFGAPNGPRPLRGLGSGIIPQVLDHTLYDEVHWVPAANAFAATRRLHSTHCVYAGPSSGAAWLVARWWTTRHPQATALVVLPDEGHRYQNTVYRDDWLHRHGLLRTGLPHAPDEIDHPSQVRDRWCWLRWGRRLRAEAVG